MDLTKLMEDIRSLHLKLDGVTKTIEKNTKTLSTLEKKVNDIDELQRIGSETVRKSANSINTIVRMLADLRKLTPKELKDTLVEADALLNTVHPIPDLQNIDETLEWDVTKNNLRNILKEVFDLLNSLPLVTNVNTNHSVASTIRQFDNSCCKVEEDKLHIWRKYKNRYNYIEKLKPKFPPVEEVVSLQEDVQNYVNPIVENVDNLNVQNDENNLNEETPYTVNDIIQKREVYEFFKQRLKNSPYEDPVFKNNVINDKLTLKLDNGKTFVRPVSHVAPLIVLKKCDDLCPTLLQNKKTTDQHFQSTSKYINNSSGNNTTSKTDERFQSTSYSIDNSNSNNTIAKMIERVTRYNKTNDITNRTDEHFQSTSYSIDNSSSNNLTAKTDERKTRANKTKDITNSFNTNGKTTTKKRRSTIKTSKYEPSKKRKQ